MPPQDIPADVADPLINRILGLDESEFLDIGDVQIVEVKKGQAEFEAKPCASCGELTFVNKLRQSPDGKLVCIPCSGNPD